MRIKNPGLRLKICSWPLLLPLFILVSGCGKAWTISQYRDRGVIGYSGFHSSQKAAEAIEGLIPCRPYSVVSDDLISNTYTYTGYEPMTTHANSTGSLSHTFNLTERYNYQQSTSSTTYVPVQKTGVAHWRELTYSCGGPVEASQKPLRNLQTTREYRSSEN